MIETILDPRTWDMLQRDIMTVMTHGQPPIHMQFIAVTAAFILFKLWRMRRRNPYARPSNLRKMAPSIIYITTLAFLANRGLDKIAWLLRADTWERIVLDLFGRA